MPQHGTVFAIMAASALPHAPFSIGLHALIGVSERTRDAMRTLDVFFILTCGGTPPLPLPAAATATPS